MKALSLNSAFDQLDTRDTKLVCINLQLLLVGRTDERLSTNPHHGFHKPDNIVLAGVRRGILNDITPPCGLFQRS